MGKRQHPTRPDTDAEGGFLARWSRRKSEARTETVAAPAVSEPESVGETEAGAVEAPSITDADLPPLESLDENSDFSAFLSPGVSEALRQRALRKLFSGAKFQFRDGLDDYDEDYRSFETLGKTLTATLRHRAELEAQRLAATEQSQTGPTACDEGEPDSVTAAATADPAPSRSSPTDDGDAESAAGDRRA